MWPRFGDQNFDDFIEESGDQKSVKIMAVNSYCSSPYGLNRSWSGLLKTSMRNCRNGVLVLFSLDFVSLDKLLGQIDLREN